VKVIKVKLSVEKGNEKVNEFYVKLGYILKRTTKETYDFEKNLFEGKKSYTSW
jgi:methyl coenzyme M reductase alpha subunit